MSSMGLATLQHQATLANYDVGSYNDLNALQSIKYGDSADEGRLDAVSKQFESMFVSMMLKGMRAANAAFAEDNPLNSSQVKFYQEMYDSQLAVSLSESKGIGIAEVVKRQLAGRFGLEPAGKTEADPTRTALSISDYERRNFANHYTAEQIKAAVEKVDSALANIRGNDSVSQENKGENEGQSPIKGQNQPEHSSTVSAVSGEAASFADFSDPQSYIQSLLPIAQRVEAETGIDARLMLAQSALETGWGKHQILKADGEPSFNLFGIKAQNGWQGEQADILTTEYRGGVAMKERAAFRAYDSYEESFADYARFLQGNERYEPAMVHRDDPHRFAEMLQTSGYATDPQYSEKIGRILDRYLDDAAVLAADER